MGATGAIASSWLAEARGQRKTWGLLERSGRSQEQKVEREETTWGVVLAEIFSRLTMLGAWFGCGS